MSKEYFVADKHCSVGDIFLIDNERRNYVCRRVWNYIAGGRDKAYIAHIHNYVINNILAM